MMVNSIAGCRIKLMDPIGGKPGVLAEVLPFELSTAESCLFGTRRVWF